MLTIDSSLSMPCYQQLYVQIQQAILKQNMLPGHVLPGSRALSKELGVARNTVIHAYSQLETEGYIEARRGIGFVVMKINCPSFETPLPKGVVGGEKLQEVSSATSLGPQIPIRYDLAHGNLSTEFFSHRLWHRYMAEALSIPYLQVTQEYGNHQGSMGLRREIAAYLHRARGVVCSADQIILTTGLQESLEILCKLIYKQGGSVLFEEPGYSKARAVFLNNGIDIAPARLDEHGLMMTEQVGKTSVKAVFITPSYQFPTGVVMSIQRRYDLLKWARDHRCLIIEDDYNGEFRYDGNPIPSLQSIDAQHQYGSVVYMGSVARSLAPFSNIGYLVLPQGAGLLSRYQEAYALYNSNIPWTHQAVVKALMAEGHYERHLRKVRSAFSKRHNLLLKQLATLGTGVEIINHGAGLYFILKMVSHHSSEVFIEAALNMGVKVTSTKGYWHTPPPLQEQHLFLGFSLIELKDVEDCVGRLRQAWAPLLGC